MVGEKVKGGLFFQSPFVCSLKKKVKTLFVSLSLSCVVLLFARCLFFLVIVNRQCSLSFSRLVVVVVLRMGLRER